MADALCRVTTGAGWGERALFTNGEEYAARVCNLVLLNGIPSLLGRSDLADRALALTLSAIPDAARRTEAEIWDAFEAVRPAVLALLLDALVLVLRDAPGLALPRLPRMADFARVACAAAPAFGWTAGEMLGALEENWAGVFGTVVEADPVATAVQALAEARGKERLGEPWVGTATELLAELDRRVPPDQRGGNAWPKDVARLATCLRRAAPALRRAGVEVAHARTGAARLVTIEARGAQAASPASRGQGRPTARGRRHPPRDGQGWSPDAARCRGAA
jgi:hypothetical protein